MTVAEIINKLKELKGLLDKLCYDVYHHASRHALGGEDEVHIDASQVVSGVLDLARIPDLPRSKVTDFFSPPFWENIPDKPSTYPPEPHTHTRSDITDFFSAPFWENIPDKPSTYPPEPHTHTRSEITDFWEAPFWENIPDKPSEYPPEAHTHSRSDITDFFSSPFWENIPDKPFSSLGSEFTVSGGELQVASIDFNKITNRLSSLITFDSSLVPNADGSYDLGNSSYRWRDGWFSRDVCAGYYFTYDEVGNTFHLLSRVFGDTYTHLHILPNYSNPQNKDTVIAFFGYNSKISKYDFKSLWSGSNISMFTMDCANYLMVFRGTLRPYVDNTYDLGDENYKWRNGYFSGCIRFTNDSDDVGNVRIYNSSGKLALFLGVRSDGSGRIDADVPIYVWLGGGRLNMEGGTIFSGHIYTNAHNAYDLGNSSYRWRNGYFAGTVYASQFIGNIDWSYIQNAPLVGVVLAFDDTEATVTGTTETEVKYFRFVRNSSFFNVRKIRFIVSGYSTSGTGKLKVYIDGTAYATIDLTSTSEGVYQADVDVSSLSDGIHTVSIRLVGGSSSETVVNNYVMAVGLM